MQESNIEYFAQPSDDTAAQALCDLLSILSAEALWVEIILTEQTIKVLRLTKEQFVKLLSEGGPLINCNFLVGCKGATSADMGPLIRGELRTIRNAALSHGPYDPEILAKTFSDLVDQRKMILSPVKFDLPERVRSPRHIRPVREKKP